jgi:hypothetical protein
MITDTERQQLIGTIALWLGMDIVGLFLGLRMSQYRGARRRYLWCWLALTLALDAVRLRARYEAARDGEDA